MKYLILIFFSINGFAQVLFEGVVKSANTKESLAGAAIYIPNSTYGTYSDENGKFRRAILLDKTRGRHFYDVRTKSGNILNGPWMIKEEDFLEKDKNKEIYWTSGGDEQPYGKIYLNNSTGQIVNDFWDTSFGSNQEASLNLEKLFGESKKLEKEIQKQLGGLNL